MWIRMGGKGREELEGVKGGETVIRIYCIFKNLFLIKKSMIHILPLVQSIVLRAKSCKLGRNLNIYFCKNKPRNSF